MTEHVDMQPKGLPTLTEKTFYVMCEERDRAAPYRITSRNDVGAYVHIQRKEESGITFSALSHTVPTTYMLDRIFLPSR